MGGLQDDRLLTGGGRPVVRYVGIIVVAAALAGGCAGGSKPASSPAEPRGVPTLVSFIQQRPGALIDKITVRTDGSGLFDRPSGGVGRVQRDVEIDPSAVRALRADLGRAPAHLPQGRGRLAPNGATYIVH